MAIDPSAPAKPEKSYGASAIENEIPAYRAISVTALASLGLGVASILSFADLWFLLAAVGAIAVGMLADWRIRRMPDVLTGRGFAQAGVVLGLVFGLSALTHERVDHFLLRRNLNRFAAEYADALAKEDPAAVMWYLQTPSTRAGKSPKQITESMMAGGRESKYEYMTRVQVIRDVQARLAGGGHLHRGEIEQLGYDRLTPYGAVVLELEGVGPPKNPTDTNDILLEVKGEKQGGETKWWVSDMRPNYQRQSYRLRVKPVDDGHGHGHSH